MSHSQVPVLSDVSAVPAAPEVEPGSISELIRDLSNGVRKAADLDARTRQECVLQLSLDGFSNDEIACLMRVSERTVTRLRQAAMKSHALKPDMELGDDVLGEYQLYLQTSVRRLARLCTDLNTPPAVRVRAEEAINRLYERFAGLIQRYDYACKGYSRLMNQKRQSEPGIFPKIPPLPNIEETVKAMLQLSQIKK